MRSCLIYSPTKRKLLLLLAAGITLSLARTRGQQKLVITHLPREWKNVNKNYLYRLIKEFNHNRLVDLVEQKDGHTKLVLTEQGKLKTLCFKLDEINIPKPKKWDHKWHVVMFDIPETLRRKRNTFRLHLKDLGLLELQHSVWVYPFPCRDQIDFVIEVLGLRRWVRYAEVTAISNEAELRVKFGQY
jgi:hypothetical protein